MDWIRIDAAFPTHRKSIELAEITGEEMACGRMLRLWCWARANAPDGRITGRSPARLVEAAVGWSGAVGAFAAAALEVGFLRQEGEALVIHGWDEHNGHAIRRAEASADRARRWREAKESERAERREAEIAAKSTTERKAETGSQTQRERTPNAFGAHSRTHSERVPNVERDRRDETNETRRDKRDVTTTTAGPPTPQQPAIRASRGSFQLEPELADTPIRKLSAAQVQREELRAMRAAALPGVVEDVELRSGALVATLSRIEHEATAKGSTVADAYTAFLRDDYARGCDPPCPIGLFVDANKFRECLSSALRAKGKGPPLLLASGRRAGAYVSLSEIEAQDFTIDPAELADQEHP